MILPTIIETFVLHKQSAAMAGLKSPASRAEPTLPGFHSRYKPSWKKVAARHSRLAVSRVAATLVQPETQSFPYVHAFPSRSPNGYGPEGPSRVSSATNPHHPLSVREGDR